MKKFNVSLKQLKEAVKFAENNNTEIITMHIIDTSVGNLLYVSKTFNSEEIDITDYESW